MLPGAPNQQTKQGINFQVSPFNGSIFWAIWREPRFGLLRHLSVGHCAPFKGLIFLSVLLAGSLVFQISVGSFYFGQFQELTVSKLTKSVENSWNQ